MQSEDVWAISTLSLYCYPFSQSNRGSSWEENRSYELYKLTGVHVFYDIYADALVQYQQRQPNKYTIINIYDWFVYILQAVSGIFHKHMCIYYHYD